MIEFPYVVLSESPSGSISQNRFSYYIDAAVFAAEHKHPSKVYRASLDGGTLSSLRNPADKPAVLDRIEKTKQELERSTMPEFIRETKEKRLAYLLDMLTEFPA